MVYALVVIVDLYRIYYLCTRRCCWLDDDLGGRYNVGQARDGGASEAIIISNVDKIWLHGWGRRNPQSVGLSFCLSPSRLLL